MPAVRSQQAAKIQPPQILCVDDSEAIQKVLKLALADQGYELCVVSSLAQMLGKLKGVQYDVLICDGQIAGAAQEGGLKALGGSAASPQLIVLSGSYDQMSKEDYHQAGFEHVLAKPFSCADVLTLVRSLVPEPDVPSLPAMAAEDARLPTIPIQRQQRPAAGSVNPSLTADKRAADASPSSAASWPEPYPGAASLWTDAAAGLPAYQPLSHDGTRAARDGVGTEPVQRAPARMAGPRRLSAGELEWLAAEVLQRISTQLAAQIQRELAKMVAQNIQTDIRSLIREELESLAERRSSFS